MSFRSWSSSEFRQAAGLSPLARAAARAFSRATRRDVADGRHLHLTRAGGGADLLQELPAPAAGPQEGDPDALRGSRRPEDGGSRQAPGHARGGAPRELPAADAPPGGAARPAAGVSAAHRADGPVSAGCPSGMV